MIDLATAVIACFRAVASKLVSIDASRMVVGRFYAVGVRSGGVVVVVGRKLGITRLRRR